MLRQLQQSPPAGPREPRRNAARFGDRGKGGLGGMDTDADADADATKRVECIPAAASKRTNRLLRLGSDPGKQEDV